MNLDIVIYSIGSIGWLFRIKSWSVWFATSYDIKMLPALKTFAKHHDVTNQRLHKQMLHIIKGTECIWKMEKQKQPNDLSRLGISN